MAIEDEFATVDFLVASSAETRGVDAFALALLKAERQIRRLVTFLVFQSACFGTDDIPALREALGARRIYFHHLLVAWDELYFKALSKLIGEDHDRLRSVLSEATDYRIKIFHGQLTNKYLSRDDLFGYVKDIRFWCKTLDNSTRLELGYDGLDRDDSMGSFRKAAGKCLQRRMLRKIETVYDYEEFLKGLENRPNKTLQPTHRFAQDI